jgi:biopolymer transport protein ExbD
MGLSYRSSEEDSVLSQINTTPLVDVMLVLLIIFLITIPVVTTSVKVDLPKESNSAREAKPDTIVISVDAAGNIFWYDTKVTSNELSKRLTSAAASKQPGPEIQIRGDLAVDYGRVGQVVSAAQAAGITKIGFITEPTAQ